MLQRKWHEALELVLVAASSMEEMSMLVVTVLLPLAMEAQQCLGPPEEELVRAAVVGQEAYFSAPGQVLVQFLEVWLRLMVALAVDGTWALRVLELQGVEAARQ